MTQHLRRTFLRRQFLARTGCGIATLGVAPGVLATPRGAVKSLRFGVIGCGLRGGQHLRDLSRRAAAPTSGVSITAVCDIYDPRRRQAARSTGAAAFRDYREVLASDKVDCVVIATPDHWHAKMTLDAIAAGKDIYCEKPWTRTVEEARECYRALKASDRICQIGTQHTALGAYWTAREAIASGRLGGLVWSQTSYSRNSRSGEWNDPIDPECSEKNLDWEAFLGPAPRVPFNREHFFRFRKYRAYSGGIATDLHYHKLAALLLALGGGFPRRVTSAGGIWVHDDGGHGSPREVPDTLMSVLDYPGGHSVVLASSLANRDGLPDVIRGHEATLTFGASVTITAQKEYEKEFRRRYGGKTVIRMAPKPRAPHMTNFIDCVRSRRAEDLNCGPDLGYQTMVAIGMSVRAYRENAVLFWDAQREEVVHRG